MPRVNVHNERLIFDDVFKIIEATVSYERFDGHMSRKVRRLNFDRGDSVAAVVYDPKEKTLLLTNQFKYPTLKSGSGWIIEVMAGRVDNGESAEAATRREIREELGFEVASLRHLRDFYVTPGGSSERIILFYAEISETLRRSGGGGKASEGENIQVLRFGVDEIPRLLSDGRIVDAKTIIGLMWLEEYLKQPNRI